MTKHLKNYDCMKHPHAAEIKPKTVDRSAKSFLTIFPDRKSILNLFDAGKQLQFR